MSKERYIYVIVPLKIEWEPLYALPEGAQVQTGTWVKVNFAGKGYFAVVDSIAIAGGAVDKSKIKEIEYVADEIPPVLPTEIKFWKQLADYYLCTVGEVCKAAYPFIKTSGEISNSRRLKQLEKQAEALTLKIEKARNEVTRERYTARLKEIKAELSRRTEAVEFGNMPSPVLTLPQQEALSAIEKSFSAKRTVLLQGVTGSGKTEIYISLSRSCLLEGKNILYLVPEIALSHQLEERLREYFGDALVVFHSKMTPAQIQRTARTIRNGNYMVLGTRSALFLPHNNLGLVVVDEEHEPSYKQDSPAPRYNGRDSALFLARIFSANSIIGSATPSMESLYNASVGLFDKVELKERYYGASGNTVEIIDTCSERKKFGMKGNFSVKLIGKISQTLKEGRQVMILRSRRAYSTSVQCQDCGAICKCPNCNVPLALTVDPMTLFCRYCSHTEAYTGICPECGGHLAAMGSGTAKIFEEACELFPTAKVARVDSDIPENQAQQALKSFEAGETDILVGTQMIAKGFDFKKLDLVVAIGADSLMALPDFRADERAFQTLTQLAGRSGRRSEQGHLVIQTMMPDHPVYKSIVSGSGISHLLEERRLYDYPPYCRCVLISLKDSSLNRIEYMASALSSAFPRSLRQSGAYSPPIDRIAGEYIRHIRIFLPRDRSLSASKRSIRACVEKFAKEKKYSGHISIDVDPQ